MFVGSISALFGFPFLYRKGLRLFQQSFAIVRKCRYPGQLKFKNQRQVEIIFIARFVIFVIVAFTFICFIILMVPNPNKTKFTRLLTFEVVCCLHLLLILQLLPRIVKSIPGRRYKTLIIFFDHLPLLCSSCANSRCKLCYNIPYILLWYSPQRSLLYHIYSSYWQWTWRFN